MIKIKDKLLNIFLILFTFIFIYIFLNVIFNNHVNNINIGLLKIIISTIIYIAAILFIYKKANIKNEKRWSIFILILLFSLQIIFAYLFAVKPSWDFGSVYEASVNSVLNNKKVFMNDYFYYHSNNIGEVLLLQFIFSIFHLFHFDHFNIIGIVLNIVFIDITIIYIYKILKMYFKGNKVIIFLIFISLFTPFICYTPIYYTDTISMPFISSSLYYFLKGENDNNKKNLIISGLLIGLGVCIKFTDIILFIAYIIYLIFKEAKINIKDIMKKLLFLMIGFFIAFIPYKLYIKMNFDKEKMYNLEFPPAHYLMTGLQGTGTYNAFDQDFTGKIEGKDEKTKADLRIAKERLKEKIKEKKLIEFYTNKIVYVWGDGTFFAPVKLERVQLKEYGIKKYILNSKENKNYFYKLFAQAQLLTVFLFMIIGLIFRKYLSKDEKNLQLLSSICLMGVFIFFLLWEARSRYIVNFIPILLLEWVIGVRVFMEKKDKIIEEKKNILKKIKSYFSNNKIENIMEFLVDSSVFIMIFLGIVLTLTNLLFIFKLSISKLYLPIFYILSIIIFTFLKKKNLRKAFVSIIISTIVTVICFVISSNIYDSTADGNTYHKLAVGAMKNGWNPVYQKVEDYKKYGNPFEILDDNVNVKWVNHYAKGTETFAAVVYAFSGNIESGKMYNLLWIYVGLFVLYKIFRKMNLKVWQSILLSIVLAFNPISLVQLTNYYLDGVLAITLFIIILYYLYNSYHNEIDLESYIIIGVSIIWGINTKFNGLAFVGLFCFLIYLYRHLKNYINKDKNFISYLIKDSIFYFIVVIISIAICGSTSYLKNFVTNNHPLYPLYGKGHVDNMVLMEMPKSLQNKSNLEIFLTSIFAKGENVSPSYSNLGIEPKLKIPLTFTKTELNNYNIPDIRMAGFGPLFSAVVILMLILIIIMYIDYLKHKEYKKIIPYSILFISMVLLILLLDGSYWARYIPYFYLLPIFSIIYSFKNKTKYIGILMIIILLINSALVFKTQFNSIKTTNEYIKNRIDLFNTKYNLNESKTMDIHLAHHGIQGVQYNLDDINIDNYKLVEKELENDCYMFTY